MTNPGGPVHAHLFETVTSTNLRHRHILRVFVYPANGCGTDGHTHAYQGVTEYAAGHFHRIVGRTGPAMPLPDGTHHHTVDARTDDEPFRFRGGAYQTALDIPRHTHGVSAVTGPPVGEAPPGW